MSRRNNGDLVLLNAQHRRALCIAEGYDEPVMCEVHQGLALTDEATIFLGLNDQTTPQALTKFLVRVIEGDKIALAINNIVASHGWDIGQSSKDGAISAVQALETIYLTAAGTRPAGDHEDILDQVLTTITRAWGHAREGVHQTLLQGFAQLYGRYGDAVETGKLVADLQKNSPQELLGRAKQIQHMQGGTSQAAFAKVLVGLHNNRKRTNLLPEWVWTR